MKNIFVAFFVLFSLLGCNESDSLEEQPIDERVSIEAIEFNTSVPKTALIQPFGVYNEAYQENFEADSLEEILKEAKGAYILIDPFNGEMAQEIAIMKNNQNEIGGYISVGTGEEYREDYDSLRPYLSNKAWEAWQDEFFISRIDNGLLKIMEKRIDFIASLGLDWVEFDNMDWGDKENIEKYDLEITPQRSIEYINYLCSYAHKQGLKCMAKNSVEGFESFDGVLYESYEKEQNWWDKVGTRAFLTEGKPVIINHYNSENCVDVYQFYQSYYQSDKLSFICESVEIKKYEHF